MGAGNLLPVVELNCGGAEQFTGGLHFRDRPHRFQLFVGGDKYPFACADRAVAVGA